MTDLDPRKKELLSAYRDVHAFDAMARSRVWARLENRTAAARVVWPNRQRWGILVGVSVAAALAGWMLAELMPRDVLPRVERPNVLSAQHESMRGAKEGQYRAATGGEAPLRHLPESVRSSSTPLRPLPTRKPQPVEPSGDSVTSDTSLSIEIALLRRAQQAWDEGRHAEAKRALAEHREHFPLGQMAEDREALMVRWICHANDAEGTTALAAFLRQFPGSGHIPGLQRSCR